MRLTYRILELPFRPEAVEAVRKVYETDISRAQAYTVIASFKPRTDGLDLKECFTTRVPSSHFYR